MLSLQSVDLHATARQLSVYESLAGGQVVEQIRALARQLQGLRVVHINATPDGGGVAEILRSLVPLSRDVGLDADWYTLPPDGPFFGTTKQMHNWLQGQPGELTPAHQDSYMRYLTSLSQHLRRMHADIWVIHDPQPLALRTLVPLREPAIWRCHIDCSTPNICVRDYLTPWVREYDHTVFSMPAYVMPGLCDAQVRISQPAIDPLVPKNRMLSAAEARAELSVLGIDPGRPLLTQVSRFDAWKNPWQAVDIYRTVKRHLPDVQLAMAGVFAAKDDPEAPAVYAALREYVGSDTDVHLLTDPNAVGPLQINALQSASDVVLQRSTREGFGLTVTEAMWKARPVIGTPVGGIPGQIEHGRSGYLVESGEEAARIAVQLLNDPLLARRIGRAAHASARERFLLPRLLLDELQLYAEALTATSADRRAA